MRLVLRRARQARGLLVAAGLAALVAAAMVTGLADYNRQAIAAGQRSVTTAAPAAERSLLVSGSAGPDEAEFTRRDAAVRGRFADGLGGVETRVAGARYGTGRELTGVPRGADGSPVFASLMTIEQLAEHAELVAGEWPEPGGTPLRVALPEKAARTLGVTAGDQVPLTDRATKRSADVLVSGVFRPKDPREPYWLLAPGVGTDSAAGSAYGPLVLDRADFTRTFTGTTSASWLVEPALIGAGQGELAAVRRAAATVAEELPEQAGLGTSGQVTARIDRLVDRLARADLVGRSTLLTPILLVLVLGGYALVLVAALLNEDRRAQTALLRARGAARIQITGLAAREAALVVLPAVLVAPMLAGQLLRRTDTGDLLDGSAIGSGTDPLSWATAGAVLVGCLVAMLGPTVRHGGTYLEDLAARSRPAKWAGAQRAGVDLALVALAVLAWFQLRRYSSPVAGAGGTLGIDPLLAAAPILGVLAGAVIALRLLPPATRLAERFVDRRPWTATMLGTWQAGRRPHAGPVLLLALAVGGSTLAWSLLGTWQRSLVDQADHRVGADLRVVEHDGTAPADRAARLAGLTGVRDALPAWRETIRLGRDNVEVAVMAIDGGRAGDVMRVNGQLVDGPPRALFDKLAAARVPTAGGALPAGTRRLSVLVGTPVTNAVGPREVATTAVLVTDEGIVHRVRLGVTGNDGRVRRLTADLPDTAGHPLRLVGFEIDAGQANPDPDKATTPQSDDPLEPALTTMSYRFRVTEVTGVAADGTGTPVAFRGGDWTLIDPSNDGPVPRGEAAAGTAGDVSADVRVIAFSASYFRRPTVRFSVVHAGPAGPVPVVATPEALTAANLRLGDSGRLAGLPFDVRVVGTMTAVPGSAETAGAILVDLPSATAAQIRSGGTAHPVGEWWLGVDPARHAEATAAVADLAGISVRDRTAEARAADRDPYWRAARTGLLVAATGAVLLALVGLAVDVWATARRRLAELAVLHTLGAGPRLLARALLAEQAFLAGVGVAVGVLVGAGVSATLAPLVILTPAAGRPVPNPVFELPWRPVGAVAAGLLLVAMAFGGFVAATIRSRVAAAQLRIGGER